MKAETIEALKKYALLADKFKHSYFWKPIKGAANRKFMEETNALSYECAEERIRILFKVDVTCSNIYVSKSVYVDGHKMSMVWVRKILKQDEIDKIGE
jgi:hypothetical protein